MAVGPQVAAAVSSSEQKTKTELEQSIDEHLIANTYPGVKRVSFNIDPNIPYITRRKVLSELKQAYNEAGWKIDHVMSEGQETLHFYPLQSRIQLPKILSLPALLPLLMSLIG